MDAAATIVGLVVTRLREMYSDTLSVPPLGGGTDKVWIIAGDTVVPPEWVGTDDCDTPWLWVRLVRRWRTDDFPTETVSAKCGVQRAVTVEAGVARCHPTNADAEELEQIAAIQWDDGWRIDRALCKAMADAERLDKADATALTSGDPFGPEGQVIVWSQQAHAQIAGGQ